MKKYFIFSIAAAFLLCLCYLLPRAMAQGILRESTDEDKPKIISVIFDDSGSMVGNGGKIDSYTTRWVDADYALKALAAMMDPEDQLRLYAMGDYKSMDDLGSDMDQFASQYERLWSAQKPENKMAGPKTEVKDGAAYATPYYDLRVQKMGAPTAKNTVTVNTAKPFICNRQT